MDTISTINRVISYTIPLFVIASQKFHFKKWKHWLAKLWLNIKCVCGKGAHTCIYTLYVCCLHPTPHPLPHTWIWVDLLLSCVIINSMAELNQCCWMIKPELDNQKVRCFQFADNHTVLACLSELNWEECLSVVKA